MQKTQDTGTNTDSNTNKNADTNTGTNTPLQSTLHESPFQPHVCSAHFFMTLKFTLQTTAKHNSCQVPQIKPSFTAGNGDP